MGRPQHKARKYGDAAPEVPLLDRGVPGAGAFHRSSDESLWLFARAWEPAEPHKAWATLMILHGPTDHSGAYAQLGERLCARGVAVFASDMRGWGRSDGEALHFHDIEAFARDVLADYRRIHGASSPYGDVRSRFLLGQSIGALMAAWVTSSNPQLWGGFIGASGAFVMHRQQQLSKRKVKALRFLLSVAPKLRLARPFDHALIVSDAAARREWEEDALASHGRATVAYFAELLRTTEALPERLKALHVPALLLWGTNDRVVSEEGHKLVLQASRDSRSRLLRYPGGFHNLLAEPAIRANLVADIEEWMANIANVQQPG